MIGGMITAAAGVLLGFEPIVQLVVNSSWVDLALFGAGAIALGSVVDRHGVVIKLRLDTWFNTVGERKDQIALES